MIEQTIEHNGEVYAKIFPTNTSIEGGVYFVTDDNAPLQVGIFEREAGYKVVPHKHNPRELSLPYPGECIIVQSGKLAVKIFDDQWNTVGEAEVNTDECIVIMQGGHEMTMLEPSRIFEVKQGPYLGREQDKTFRDS